MKVNRPVGILVCFVAFITNQDEACNGVSSREKKELEQKGTGANQKTKSRLETEDDKLRHIIEKTRVDARVHEWIWNVDLATFAEENAKLACDNTPRPQALETFYEEPGFLVVKQIAFDLTKTASIHFTLFAWINAGKETYLTSGKKCLDTSSPYCTAYELMVSPKMSHIGCALAKCGELQQHHYYVCEYGTNEPEPKLQPHPGFSAQDVGVDDRIDDEEAVKSHNEDARATVLAVSMQAVKPNPELAKFAKEKALLSCGGIFPKKGLYVKGKVLLNVDSAASAQTAKELVEKWKTGADLYVKTTGWCKAGLSSARENCKRYRKMVRETITAMGCARVFCQFRAKPSAPALATRTNKLMERHYVSACAYAPFDEVQDPNEEKLGNRAYIPATTDEDRGTKCGKYGREFDDEIGLCVEKK